MTIAIAGGTGTLGTLLVKRLLARGERVRVLTRDVTRAQHLAGAELHVGDVRDARSLFGFAAGASVVISAVHGFAGPGNVTPASVDRDGNAHLIAAAVDAGADFILTSGVGVMREHPQALFRMKYAAEQQLQASGAAWTIVRATAFLETWVKLLGDTATARHGPLVFGRGENPINFVSAIDVASLIEQLVFDRSTRGMIFEIEGPADITLQQLAAAVQAVKHTLPPRHVPRAALRVASLVLAPVRPGFARQCRAALALDRMDARFHGVSSRQRFTELPVTTLQDVLAQSVSQKSHSAAL